jgi:hypothetical protein
MKAHHKSRPAQLPHRTNAALIFCVGLFPAGGGGSGEHIGLRRSMQPGQDGTGGGGGGACNLGNTSGAAEGGAGGSGIVILNY